MPLRFISGLPRSGSTLLCNVLAQNPRFCTTATSGLIDLVFAIRSQWNGLPELSHLPTQAMLRTMQGAMYGFHSEREHHVIFDKSRGWTSEIELLEAILQEPVKIIVPVRDIRDILASLEKLWRRNFAQDRARTPADYLQCQTVEGRCHFWLRNTEMLGIAYGRIVDALHRGFADRLYILHFERWTAAPRHEFAKLYEFLQEPYFEHNFESIAQVTVDNDAAYGMGDLHTIRARLEPATPQWPAILGDFAANFGELNFK